MRFHRFHTPRLILLSAALAILPAAAHAQWGYAWANQPTVANYVADSRYSRSSSNQPIKIKQWGVGAYQVRFPGLGGGTAPKGTVQVTATSGGRECKVKGWTDSGADVLVDVLCFNATGGVEHSSFMVLLVRSNISLVRQGYALADQPTSATYVPSASGSYNSSGGGIEIKRNSPGDYEVLFKGLGAVAEVGNFQVTAYGPGSEVCTIRDWVVAAPHLTVKVQCSNTLGMPFDTTFTILVEAGDSAFGSLKQAYAWGHQPMAMFYNPPAAYANGPGAIEITRSDMGSYTLKFLNLGGNPALLGNVQVKAQGFKGEFCNPVEFFNSGSSLGVQLKCYTAAGALADMPYLVLIEK